MPTDHKTATTTSSLDDVRAVASAYARVAADLCDDARVQAMLAECLAGNVAEADALVQPFNEEYHENYRSLSRDVYVRCAAAFSIEAAANAWADPDADEAILAARTARSRCECVAQCIDFGVVDLSGPNHAASQAKVDALASKYVSAETIAAVLA